MRFGINRILAASAGVLAVAALIAGDNVQNERAATVDAVTLAEWIRDRKANLRVIDVRGRVDFEEYRIPTAEPAEKDLTNIEFNANDVVLIYSDGDDSAQLAAERIASQVASVYVLEGGIFSWLDQVMSPQLPPNATATQKRDFDRQKLVSEYFGGTSTIFEDGTPKARDVSDAVKRLRRKTC